MLSRGELSGNGMARRNVASVTLTRHSHTVVTDMLVPEPFATQPVSGTPRFRRVESCKMYSEVETGEHIS